MRSLTKTRKPRSKRTCCAAKSARTERRSPVIAQCCSKRSRVVAGCHDAL
jgi:hypothetical protein